MSDDTTWFWKIVDARGLADVSSDEFVALNELISKAEKLDEMTKAARAVEAWWLEDGRYAFNGCPYCIFAIRDALVGSGRNRADATPNPLSEGRERS